MPQIISGKVPPWSAGEIVTAGELNGMIDSAILDPSCITAQTDFTTLTGNEYCIIVDPLSGLLKKTQLKNILLTGEDLKTDYISQKTGSSTILTIQSNPSVPMIVDGVGGLTLKSQSGNIGIETLSAGGGGNFAIQANGMIFDGQGGSATGVIDFQTKTIFSATSAVKIPVGTTAQRPATPTTGDTRFNTTTSLLEYYNGTTWISGNGVASGTYSLYEVFEETITNYSSVTNGIVYWTSSQFTKPSDEIWVFEVDTNVYVIGTSSPYNLDQHGIFSITNSTSTTTYKAINIWITNNSEAVSFNGRFVVKSGTALTSEVIKIWRSVGTNGQTNVGIAQAAGSEDNKFRIYKYKSTLL